jgi:protein-disulfide isomerase
MYDSDGPSSRRAFLAGTAGSLAALAGCTSSFQSGDGGATNGGGTTTSGASGSLLYASDEKTGYGIDLADNPLMGSADASLDVYYWTDYQCPFCARFEEETLPKLVENYVRPGVLRMVVMENPYFGEASRIAARMSKCVWRQVKGETPDAYRRWHSSVFDEQGKKNSGWAKKDNLLDITTGVEGVDAEAVETCLDENEKSLQSSIDADVQAASQSGIRGTPAFVFYNPATKKSGKVVGAQPYTLFEKAIKRMKNA